MGRHGDHPPPDDIEAGAVWGWQVVLGLSLATAGCFSSSSANILVKYTESKNNQLPEHLRKPAWKRPTWYLIIFLYVADAVGDMVCCLFLEH